MRLTNRLGLPASLVAAVQRWAAKYDKGDADFSATQLIKPPLLNRLQRDHKDEIVEDVLDRLFALQGQVIHAILEEGAQEDEITEIRLFSNFDRWRVSGQADVYIPDEGLIQDYKNTKVWSVMDGVKPEWERQLNILAELVRRNGGEVKKLQIVALFTDWSPSMAKRGGRYPYEKAGVIDVPLWPSEKAVEYILERCRLHQAALDAGSPEDVMQCAPEERWHKPDRWAVMRPGRKSAVRLHDTEEGALQHAGSLGGKHYVEHRSGEDVRCDGYCNVKTWCPYKKEG